MPPLETAHTGGPIFLSGDRRYFFECLSSDALFRNSVESSCRVAWIDGGANAAGFYSFLISFDSSTATSLLHTNSYNPFLTKRSTYKNSIEQLLPAEHNAISVPHPSTVSPQHIKLYITPSLIESLS